MKIILLFKSIGTYDTKEEKFNICKTMASDYNFRPQTLTAVNESSLWTPSHSLSNKQNKRHKGQNKS